MARSDRSGGKELHLLKSILNSSSQCSLSEDPKPKETVGDDSCEYDSNQKTDTDDSPLTSARGGQGDGHRVARPKTSHGGRMLESRRRNPRTIRNRRASVEDAGSDVTERRQRMYRRVCVDEERAEPKVARKNCPKSRGRSASSRRADYVAVHTNSLEQKYQELRDLLENQFLQEREELNRSLLKKTRQVMHTYRLAQSGYVAPRPTTAPAGRRRCSRAAKESDTQSTQTNELAQLRNTEDDIRLGEARYNGDTFILIDGTKENGVSVTKHVTFVSGDEGSVYRALADGDVVDSEQQNVKRPGRLQRGREKTRDNGATRHRRKLKTGDSTADSVQRRRPSDDTSAHDSDSSLGSTGYRGRRKLSDVSNSPTTTASTSPSRGSSSIGPLCDHHLKYSSNGKLIEWLRRKNRVYRQQMAEERKAARKKRREEEEEQREKEMKREEAKHAMELWLKKKKSEERLLRKRQRTEAAFNLQQHLNANIDNEVTLGTTVFLRSRDSRDGSTSARGKQYASSVSHSHSKTTKPKRTIIVRNKSTNDNSRVDDTNDLTMPSAGNDHECMCGFSGDPNVSPFITHKQESTTERAKCADTEQTRPDSVNKQLPSHDHRSMQKTSSKVRLGSCGKAPERRQSADSKRRSITSNNRLHKVRNQETSGEVKQADDEDTDVTDATPVTDNGEDVSTNTGRRKSSVSRPASTVCKGRRRRIRASEGQLIDKVRAENVTSINTAKVDDDAAHPQGGEPGENGQETPQSKELGRVPRRPSSGRPRSARRGRRLSFGAPSPPKPSAASPTIGQPDPNAPKSGRVPRKGRPHNASPASATSSLSASQSAGEKRPTTPKPELAHTRPGYEKVQYQQKSWDSFSEHVWKQVNEDESDHVERPEPQGSDKPDDNPSTVSEPRDVTSIDRETTSSISPAADAEVSGKDRGESEKSNEDENGDNVRNGCGDSSRQAKMVSGQSMEETTDRARSSPTAGTGGETSEDVRTLSLDTDCTSSDDSVQEDVEVESDSSSSTQPNIQETGRENDTGSVFVKNDNAATEAVTKTNALSPVDVNGKRDENDNTDKDVTFLTNAEEA